MSRSAQYAEYYTKETRNDGSCVYRCNTCGNSIKGPSTTGINYHIKAHLGETIPGHYCNYCDLNKPNIWSVQKHQIDQHTGANYVCTKCWITWYGRMADLTKHHYLICPARINREPNLVQRVWDKVKGMFQYPYGPKAKIVAELASGPARYIGPETSQQRDASTPLPPGLLVTDKRYIQFDSPPPPEDRIRVQTEIAKLVAKDWDQYKIEISKVHDPERFHHYPEANARAKTILREIIKKVEASFPNATRYLRSYKCFGEEFYEYVPGSGLYLRISQDGRLHEFFPPGTELSRFGLPNGAPLRSIAHRVARMHGFEKGDFERAVNRSLRF